MDMEVDDNTSKPTEEKPNQIVVVLVGPPGSGKSTFCDNVMRCSSRPWSRVCQDTINNGKAGTKPQCIKRAVSELKEGKSVFIDRCNLDREQRADFVKLHGPGVDVHAVVLDLPAQVCISRSVKRTGHEGNLQGGKAAAVVNRMLQNKELPKLYEGFFRIVFCGNDNDVHDAVDSYRKLGPLERLPNGCFGQKSSGAKVQLGIMKFLKKVDVPSGAGSSSDSIRCSEQVGEGSNPCCKGEANVSLLSGNGNGNEGLKQSDFVPTLAFPSISTADFRFDNEKASDIIVDKVDEFVNKLGNARLVLVDLSRGSKILSLVRAKAAQRNIDEKKFFTFVGDITQLYSQGGLPANVIANTGNWRLKPGGGGVNAAIFNAAGPALEVATKERSKSILPGHAVVVPLPSDSPLYSREGVSHVIHVLGPNMNPQRPNCLDNDYDKGCKVLREAYTSLFDGFLSIVRTHQSGYGNHLANGDQKIKRDDNHVSERSKKSKGSNDENGAAVIPSSTCANEKVSGDKSNSGSTSKSWGSWAQALYYIAKHPERHKGELLEISDDVVVLNDLYPKARRHLLVLARHEGLDRLADVRQEHLPLLLTMHSVGLKWAEKFLHEDSSTVFRLGYHSAPSMRQLHLHVISQDFGSNHLKNKKHWNSFNSAFFRDSVDVIEEIRNNGRATLKDEDSFLSMELRCHRCRSAHPNIPRLKSHISNCQAPFPRALLENGRLVRAQDNV